MSVRMRRRIGRLYVPNKHRYWRVRAVTIQSGGAGAFGVATVNMRAFPGGSDQCSGGTALSDSNFSGVTAANAFDGNDATLWSSTTGGSNHYIGYDFGAPVNVNEVRIVGRADSAVTNGVTLYVESSDNNSTWTTQWKHTKMADWATSEVRTLTRPAYGDLRQYWRLHFVSSFLGGNYCSFSELAIHDVIGSVTNLASSSNVVADTTYDGTATVTNLFDGSAGTWWVSGNVPAGTGNPFPHWITFDAGSPVRVGEYVITSRSATETLMPNIIILQASLDQKTWVDYKRSGYPGVAASTVYPFSNEAPFEYIAA